MSAKFTNTNRAARCAKVLKRYGTDDTPKGCLVDFLADARHWCDQSGEEFGRTRSPGLPALPLRN